MTVLFRLIVTTATPDPSALMLAATLQRSGRIQPLRRLDSGRLQTFARPPRSGFDWVHPGGRLE